MSSATETIVFQFRCPRCYVALVATTERVGEPFVCPECGASGQVPEATSNRIAAAQTLDSSALDPLASSGPIAPNPSQTFGAEVDYRTAYREFRDQCGAIASPLGRLVARCIDVICLMVAMMFGAVLAMGVAMLSGVEVKEKAETPMMIVLLATALGPAALLQLAQWLWMASEGKTIGKKLMGIRIANKKDDMPPGFLQAVVMRTWVNYLLGVFIPFYSAIDIGYIFSHDARCLHDRLAGTIVLEGNVPRKAAE